MSSVFPLLALAAGFSGPQVFEYPKPLQLNESRGPEPLTGSSEEKRLQERRSGAGGAEPPSGSAAAKRRAVRSGLSALQGWGPGLVVGPSCARHLGVLGASCPVPTRCRGLRARPFPSVPAGCGALRSRCAHHELLRAAPPAPTAAFTAPPLYCCASRPPLDVFSYERFQGEGNYLITRAVIYGRGGRGRSRPMCAMLEGEGRVSVGSARGQTPRGCSVGPVRGGSPRGASKLGWQLGLRTLWVLLLIALPG